MDNKTMTRFASNLGSGTLLGAVLALAPFNAHAEVNTSVSSSDFASMPIVSVETATPFAMINMSNDHQLYFKAYNDYTDLDSDGALDTTYDTTYQYYGYFDPQKCYQYTSSSITNHTGSAETENYFQPVGFAEAGTHYCNGSSWSGNFLNWATMTRIDIVRKILFGGLRRIDGRTENSNPNVTLLERTYLPNDAHSFAKYYKGSDINKLTPFTPANNELTICNTTLDSTFSKTSLAVTERNKKANSGRTGQPPLIRVAEGNHALWANNERWQCLWSEEQSASNGNNSTYSGISASSSNPSSATNGLGNVDYEAHVQVCVPGLLNNSSDSIENCKQYPHGNYKPTGLLQDFGDDGRLKFGLTAGTYSNNKKGGDLMQTIEGDMRREVDLDVGGDGMKGDGHFIDAWTSGQDANQADGIVNALSLYQIIKYDHTTGTYGNMSSSQTSANDCPWNLKTFDNGTCQNWGNPFGEIYLQTLRYYANAGVSGTFRSNDSNDIPGLNQPPNIPDPITETNRCASLNTVNFNSSTISYDADNIASEVTDIGMDSTTEYLQYTSDVGGGEGMHGNDWFFGGFYDPSSDTVSGNRLCTGKTMSDLSSVSGLCPEAAKLEGSFHVAGLAYYAHTNDINDGISDPQIVDTYSVSLSTSTPKMTVPTPGGNASVTIIPACRNIGDGTEIIGNCAITDFKVIERDLVNGIGKFYVSFETSEQGGDYDQDIWGTIEYEITDSTITITTQAIDESSSQQLGLGYILSGTEQDGFHAHSGSNGFSYSDPTGANSCSDCQVTDPPTATSETYILGASTADQLRDPLFYASKWGAFEDENDNNIPDLQSEWDRKLTDGTKGQDGIPDTYFQVTNPAALEDSLRRVFNDILAKTASGTAAAVVANAREGLGAVYQALYEPLRKDVDNREVRWIGTLHSLFVDDNGFLREDTDGDDALDDYATDHVIQLFYDNVEQKTRFRRLHSDSATELSPVDNETGEFTGDVTSHPLTDLGTVWNAREQLSGLAEADLATQRTYGTEASSGRHILTWIDKDNDSEVDTGERLDFTKSAVSDEYGYFNAADSTEAGNIIDWVRGIEIDGLRNRTMDYGDDGTIETLRLGDIVHSTPTVAGPPAESFDLLYDDASYAEFRRQYANRRSVVIVGSNGGLLHGFNAGFYDAANNRYVKTTSAGETSHPLGAELWAYAPMNLLPHLKWLTEEDYPHVFYMDQKARVFDARIFTDDADHPNGWGTVAVVGMRLGGGEITVDTGKDGLGAGEDKTMRSAYVVLDITNPEKPPEVIAELTPSDVGFTTSFPTAMAFRDDSDDDPDEWYLVFGNGPDDFDFGTSSRDAKLYVYNLNTRQFVSGYDGSDGGAGDLDVAESFVGDPVSVDWDLDFFADAVYFGTGGATVKTTGGETEISGQSGRLFRFGVNENELPADWTAPKTLFDAGQPVLATPAVTLAEDLTPWVLFGTGRFLVEEDKVTSHENHPQALYGLKDTLDPNHFATPGPVDSTKIVDVTNTIVMDDGELGGTTTNSDATTFTELDQDIHENKHGWKLSFPDKEPGITGNPATRNITQGAVLGKTFLASAYTPSDDLCGNEGVSDLFGVHFRTGTARPNAIDPIFGGDTDPDVQEAMPRSISLGQGMAASPSLQNAAGIAPEEVKVFTQTSTGAIQEQESGVDKGSSSGESDWQEPKK